MYHMQETFDDSCQELMALRWFRDNFVLKEDIKHYNDIAPIIVNLINLQPNTNKIYKSIAYDIYKNSVLVLEEKFAKPIIQQQFVKTLKKIRK